MTELNMTIKGKTILFTGKCSLTRTDMKKEANSKGAIATNNFGRKVDIIVYGESYKQYLVEKAGDFGIEVLSEEEYRKRLNSTPKKS